MLLATTSFRGRDYVEALRDAVPGLDLADRAAAHRRRAGAAPRGVRAVPTQGLLVGEAW